MHGAGFAVTGFNQCIDIGNAGFPASGFQHIANVKVDTTLITRVQLASVKVGRPLLAGFVLGCHFRSPSLLNDRSVAYIATVCQSACSDYRNIILELDV